MCAKKKKESPQEEERHFDKKDLPETPTKKGAAKKKGKQSKETSSDTGALPKKEQERIERELTQIYENSDGSMPDMSHFERKKKSRMLSAFFTLLVSVLLFGAVAYAGLFVFEGNSEFSQSDVILSVVGEESLQNGGQMHYRIRYRNAQRYPLYDSLIRVRFPEGFILDSAEPNATNEGQTEWDLNVLDPGESGYIDIFGTLHGNLGDKQSLRVFLNYTPANFSSEFQTVATLTSETETSLILVDIDGPDEVLVGSEVSYTVFLRNESEEDANYVVATIPEEYGFVLKESSLEPDQEGEARWTFDSLEDVVEFTITGSFSDTDQSGLHVDLIQYTDETYEGEGYLVAQNTLPVMLSETDISANLVINGTLKDFMVVPGDTLNTSIVLKNIGSEAVENVQITLIFDAPSYNNKSILDWIELDDSENGKVVGDQRSEDIRRGSITWTSAQMSALAKVNGGDDVTIDLSLPIQGSDEVDLSLFDAYEITGMLEVQFDKGDVRESFSSEKLTMTMHSDLALEVRDEISGQDHTVTWLLSNSFHDLKNITVEADLYGDFEWNQDDVVVPAGEVTFDPDTKKIKWHIPDMPKSIDVLALQFELSSLVDNPSQTNLTSKVKVSAYDNDIGQEFTIVGDEILINQ